MRRPSTRSILGVTIPLVLVILLVAAWAVDTGGGSGKSVRNVEIRGRDVGRLEGNRLDGVVQKVADRFGETPVRIRTGDQTYETLASSVGLEVDVDATVDDILAEGREGMVLTRPLAWAMSFVAPREVEPVYRMRTEQLRAAIGLIVGADAQVVEEPTLVGTPDTVGIRGGRAGSTLDADVLGPLLLKAAQRERDPIVVDTELVPLRPTVTDEQAQAVATDLAAKTSQPLTVTAGPAQVVVDVATVRSWITSTVDDGKLVPALQADKVIRDLQQEITGLTPRPQDAKITLVGNQVVIEPSKDGQSCCAPETPTVVLGAILAGKTTVSVPLIVEKPKLTTEQANALGIKEPVGTTTVWNGQTMVKQFTTFHACCEPRVHNIHRMADIVRGTVVLPGETFSVNEVVGQRTEAKGFVEAGAIANGIHVQEVGGGVSQFATTMFNAAFFAGLPFGEYQAHSEHFTRYPRGREATMGYPHPDLQWVNDTPYGILVWTSYTDTSLTIQLWSTQHAWGEQTAQTESPSGNCTRVTTTRTIHYPDGSTKTDTVGALYRPGEGISC